MNSKTNFFAAGVLVAGMMACGAVQAQTPDAETLKQLAAEASGSSVGSGAPAAGVADPQALVDKITRDLESYLKVAPDQPIKKSSVVEAAEKARQAGSANDDIQRAVADALSAMMDKGVRFEPGTHAFIQTSMRDLLADSASVAAGDPASAYIQSLNAELANTRVTTSAAESPAMPASPIPAPFTMASQVGPKGTITVVAGESLSSIAHRVYGDAALYPVIFDANRDRLPTPNEVFVGQVLRIPKMTAVNP